MHSKIYYSLNVLTIKYFIGTVLSCHYSILNYVFIDIKDINYDIVTFAIEIRFN